MSKELGAEVLVSMADSLEISCRWKIACAFEELRNIFLAEFCQLVYPLPSDKVLDCAEGAEQFEPGTREDGIIILQRFHIRSILVSAFKAGIDLFFQ